MERIDLADRPQRVAEKRRRSAAYQCLLSTARGGRPWVWRDDGPARPLATQDASYAKERNRFDPAYVAAVEVHRAGLQGESDQS